MKTFADVINRWPTGEEFAQDLGISGVRARAWRNRNSIPSAFWCRLVAAAEARGFDDITERLLSQIAEQAEAA